jgi:hypothetical protein
MSMRPSDQEPIVYAIRVAIHARDTLLRERERRAEIVGQEAAVDWY